MVQSTSNFSLQLLELAPHPFDIYSQELRAREAGQVVQNIPWGNCHTSTTRGTATSDVKIQDTALWANTGSLKTPLPFSMDFHIRPSVLFATECLQRWQQELAALSRASVWHRDDPGASAARQRGGPDLEGLP